VVGWAELPLGDVVDGERVDRRLAAILAAVRVESECEPGGVCLSGSAFEKRPLHSEISATVR